MFRCCFVLFFLIALVGPACAAQAGGAQKPLGSFGAWKAYSYTEGGQPVCYMTANVHRTPNKKFKRGAAYLMITHRPGESSRDVISYTSGYNFKPASDVTVTIDKKTFSLFTQKDTAWSRDTATDRALTAAMRNGRSMKFSGFPAVKGMRAITDTIDLKDTASAYKAIGKACGLESEATPKPGTKKPVSSNINKKKSKAPY